MAPGSSRAGRTVERTPAWLPPQTIAIADDDENEESDNENQITQTPAPTPATSNPTTPYGLGVPRHTAGVDGEDVEMNDNNETPYARRPGTLSQVDMSPESYFGLRSRSSAASASLTPGNKGKSIYVNTSSSPSSEDSQASDYERTITREASKRAQRGLPDPDLIAEEEDESLFLPNTPKGKKLATPAKNKGPKTPRTPATGKSSATGKTPATSKSLAMTSTNPFSRPPVTNKNKRARSETPDLEEELAPVPYPSDASWARVLKSKLLEPFLNPDHLEEEGGPQIPDSGVVLTPGTRDQLAPIQRPRPEDDPENILIKELREAGYGWRTIAQHLTARRGDDAHMPPEAVTALEPLTAPVVYGRFVRTAPRIAKARGEETYDVRAHMQLRPGVMAGQGVGKDAPMQGRPGYATAPPVGMKRPVVRRHDRAACFVNERLDELLVHAVEEVKEGFWITVADTLERRCGLHFRAEVLRERWSSL